MNSKPYQPTQPKQVYSDSCTVPPWREADHYQPKYYTAAPAAKQRVEEEVSETVVVNNVIQADQLARQRSVEQRSDIISKLSWLLLGLSSLLFLGSLLMLIAYGKSTNTNSITKETVNNINRTREVIRTDKVEDTDAYYYAPRARW
jgi:hypothetical protein